MGAATSTPASRIRIVFPDEPDGPSFVINVARDLGPRPTLAVLTSVVNRRAMQAIDAHAGIMIEAVFGSGVKLLHTQTGKPIRTDGHLQALLQTGGGSTGTLHVSAFWQPKTTRDLAAQVHPAAMGRWR
jgi:hypothetical protein